VLWNVVYPFYLHTIIVRFNVSCAEIKIRCVLATQVIGNPVFYPLVRCLWESFVCSHKSRPNKRPSLRSTVYVMIPTVY